MLLQADGDRCTVGMVLDWTGVGWAGLGWGCTYLGTRVSSTSSRRACMTVGVRVVSVNVNASGRGRLLCACVDRRRRGWQVDPRLAGGRQRQRQREEGACRSSGAGGDTVSERASE